MTIITTSPSSIDIIIYYYYYNYIIFVTCDELPIAAVIRYYGYYHT